MTSTTHNAPVQIKIEASDPLEAEERLNAAERELRRLAEAEGRRGILVTQIAPGTFIAELSDDVAYGTTEDERLVPAP